MKTVWLFNPFFPSLTLFNISLVLDFLFFCLYRVRRIDVLIASGPFATRETGENMPSCAKTKKESHARYAKDSLTRWHKKFITKRLTTRKNYTGVEVVRKASKLDGIYTFIEDYNTVVGRRYGIGWGEPHPGKIQTVR